MSFWGQTLRNPLHRPNGRHNTGDTHWWRWIALVIVLIVLIALIAAGAWAWPRFINTGDATTQATAPVVVSASSSRDNVSTTTTQTQPAVQAQPAVENAPAPIEEPAAAPAAAAAITTTQATRMVVIAGTEGATLLTIPDGEPITTVAVGALLSATGRSEDSGWIYVSSTDDTTGWVAVEQLVAFGLEKLPVVTLPASASTQPAVASATPATTTAVLSATAPSSATTAVITATNNITAPDAEAVTAAMAETVAAGGTSTVSASGVMATVTVTGSRLNIRSGPGTRYAIVGKASRNDEVSVLARNGAADWVQIVLPASEDGFGWVAAAYLRLSGDIQDLPIADAVSAAPAVAATSSTSTSATQAAETSPTVTQAVATQSVATVSTGSATGLSGTLVFQSSPGGMIYAYNLATGRLWQLTNGFDPAISPDGQTVVFVRTAGENGIYLINSDGSNERLIFSGRNTLAAPKWSPDGNYIVFTRGDEYKECRDLGRGMCLTDDELLDQNPNFPLDDFPLIKDYESNLARIDINGDNYRDIANLESARAADWNEAGIVYQSTAGLQITADEPDATNQLVVHDPFKPAYEDPDWQPNGGRIVFVSRGGNHREIYAVNPDGSGMVALTKPVTTLVDELPNNVAPAWSPDGQYIVFLSNRGDDNSAGAWKLWVMDADGSNQHPLPIDVAINYTYGNEQVVGWGP